MRYIPSAYPTNRLWITKKELMKEKFYQILKKNYNVILSIAVANLLIFSVIFLFTVFISMYNSSPKEEPKPREVNEWWLNED